MRTAAVALACGLAASMAQAREVERTVVGPTPDGVLSIDQSSRHDHHLHGYQRIEGRIELSQPVEGDGETAAASIVDVTLDFDCARGSYRVMRRAFRGSDGEYLGSDFKPGDWQDPEGVGGLIGARDLACPLWRQQVEDENRAAHRPSRQGRRAEAVVIEMPRQAR